MKTLLAASKCETNSILVVFRSPRHSGSSSYPSNKKTILVINHVMTDDYVDRTLVGVDELWSGLQSLAACHSYREVSMIAGARIIQSLRTGSKDAVRAAISTFEPAPLAPLPPYKQPQQQSRNWGELRAAIDRLPSYAGAAPTASMADRCLPSLRARVQMEIESRKSSSSQPTKSVRASSDTRMLSDRSIKRIRPD